MIRAITSPIELEQVKQLDEQIWGRNDATPTHQTITAVKNGGMVLGAFDGEKLIGFQYSFAGFNGKIPYLCSHQLGVLPAYRNKGLGERLKHAQKKLAKEMGYSLITWTFDPLETINGYLNIQKLGGICSKYIENCYGEMNDSLNKGLPSDRFLLEWWLDKENTNNKTTIPESLTQLDNSVIPEQIHTLEGKSAYVAVPDNFREMKITDKKLAIKWRMKTRETFIPLFKDGWYVTGFIKNNHFCFYLLSKKEDSNEY